MTWRVIADGLLCLVLCTVGNPVHAGTDSTLKAAIENAEAAPRVPYHPRGNFMVRAPVRDISMSPDGKWLAFRRDNEDRAELWLRSVDSGKEIRVMADSEGTDATWSGDGARLWLPDAEGLGVFDTATRSGRRLFRFDPERKQAFWRVDAGAPAYAVLSEKVPVDGHWVFRYLAIDAKGRTQVIYEARRPLTAVLLDEKAEPRYVAGYDGPEFDTVIWQVVDGRTQELMRCPIPQQCRPLAYDGDTVWALAHNGENLMSLHRHDADADRWQVLQSDPRGLSDAVSVLMQPDGKDWFAVAYQPDRVEWHGRTKSADTAIAALQAALPGANLDIDPTRDGKRWFIEAAKADWQYDRYYFYTPTENRLTPLFATERSARVPAAQMADMLPLHWRNQDGIELHGYAFLPKGVPLEKAPIIAEIHGGPYKRTEGTMDVGMQLLVNRGYVVFKPNFRSSTGYGIQYVTGPAGNFGKHGGALDDILSGLDHLIANGIGDPHQQAVVGHSFGGYASLLAVTHYPQRFAFAVPSAAPVDIAWTMEDIAVEGGSALPIDGPPVEVLFPHYGVPYDDAAWHERMHDESPMAHANALSTPVYLWAGGKDDRVAVESLVRYVAETPVGHRPTLLIDPDSGHSPHVRLHSEALAWLIENAAHVHFGGAVTPPSAELAAFLKRNLHAAAIGN